MNPIIVDIIGNLIRKALFGVGVYLVSHHVVTPEQSSALTKWLFSPTMGYVTSALAVGWSLFRTWAKRLKLVTAIQNAATTEDAIEKQIADPFVANPSVSTPKDAIPKPPA